MGTEESGPQPKGQCRSHRVVFAALHTAPIGLPMLLLSGHLLARRREGFRHRIGLAPEVKERDRSDDSSADGAESRAGLEDRLPHVSGRLPRTPDSRSRC